MTTTVLASVSDPALLDEVRRAAAAADTPLQTTGPVPARQQWLHATVAVLDVHAAAQGAQAHLPRRANVIVVTAGEPVLAAWRAATAVGADQVLGLPQEASVLVSALSQPAGTGPGGGHVVAVIGGRGGAGASTLAAAVALTSAATRFRPHTLLVDGDTHGGGIDVLLGAEGQPGLRWPGLSLESGRVAAAALHGALPAVVDGLQVLACGRTGEAGPGASAAAAVLAAGSEAGDLVVCDVPRTAGAAASTMVDAAGLVILVVPADLRAIAAAQPVASFLLARNTQVHLVVRGPSPGGLTAPEVAAAVRVQLLTAMRPQPGLAGRLERGGLRMGRRGPLRAAASAILGRLEGAEQTAARRRGQSAMPAQHAPMRVRQLSTAGTAA